MEQKNRRKRRSKSNILIFPTKNKVVLTEQQKKDNEMFIKYERIEYVVDDIVENLLICLNKNNITLNETAKTAKEFAFCVEAIKSLICSNHKVKYPVQKIAAKIFRSSGDNSITLISGAAITKMVSGSRQ